MTDRSITARLPAAWRDFARFLRSPQPAVPLGIRAGWRTAAAMFGLNLIGLAVLLLVLPLWQKLTGIEGPNAFKGIPIEYLIPAVVLAAPIAEESLFRGWLSGRPRALWLLGWVLGGVLLLVVLPVGSGRAGMALLAAMVAALAGWIALRRRAAPGWFVRGFPAIFYLAAGLFGLVHVLNYAHPGALHLPMVLPQVWAGLTLGFVRTRVGLPASMLVHGASNAMVLALAVSGGGM